jgi:hypothetical protein
MSPPQEVFGRRETCSPPPDLFAAAGPIRRRRTYSPPPDVFAAAGRVRRREVFEAGDQAP